MKTIFQFLIVCVSIFFAQSAYSQVAVVVSAKSDVGTMSSEQISSIFLGKSDKFPGGGVAAPFDQAAGNPLRTSFYDKVAGKSEAQVKAAWSRLVFSGKATPPKEVSNSAEMKKAIAGNPLAIGYIEKSAVDSSVKVVFSVD